MTSDPGLDGDAARWSARGVRRLSKWLLAIGLALVVLVAAGVRRDRRADELESRWALPPSRFVRIDGLRVHYRDRGRGPAIVLLHGANASLFTWEGWVAALAGDHRVITVDLPGYGLTGPDPQARYASVQMVDFVDHLVAALGVDHFVIGGNSLGGGVAWRYALLHPDKIDKLILVDAAGFPQAIPSVMRIYAVPVLGRIARWVTPRFLVERSLRDVYGDPSRLRDEVVEQYYELNLREGNREAALERLSAPRGDDGMLARLGEIRAPTLILWGTRDHWILPDRADRFARAIPHAQSVLLEGLGHVPMEEDPARSVAAVVRFLSSS